MENDGKLRLLRLLELLQQAGGEATLIISHMGTGPIGH